MFNEYIFVINFLRKIFHHPEIHIQVQICFLLSGMMAGGGEAPMYVESFAANPKF